MSKKTPEVKIVPECIVVKPAPVTRDQLFSRIKAEVKEEVVDGIGLVRYRNLSFEEHYKMQMYAHDSAEFAARAIVAGIVEPKFTEEDIPDLKAGKFGLIAKLGHLPLKEVSAIMIKDTDLAK